MHTPTKYNVRNGTDIVNFLTKNEDEGWTYTLVENDDKFYSIEVRDETGVHVHNI